MESYTLTLVNGSIEPQWTKAIPFHEPEAAIEHARTVIEAEAAATSERPMFLAVGRGEGAAVRWLGIWEWEAGPAWKPGG